MVLNSQAAPFPVLPRVQLEQDFTLRGQGHLLIIINLITNYQTSKYIIINLLLYIKKKQNLKNSVRQ